MCVQPVENRRVAARAITPPAQLPRRGGPGPGTRRRHRGRRPPGPDRRVGARAGRCLAGTGAVGAQPRLDAPIPMVTLNEYQVALIYSLVPLALVQTTGSTADRPGG